MGVSIGRESEETGRLVALSDGVIAIAITLLVLEITVPEIPAGRPVSILSELVFEQWHEFVSYTLSFFIIGLYWKLHRRIFIHIKAHDDGVLWLNLLFLLFVAFVPYGTSLFSTYPTQFGVMFYSSVLALTGLSLTLLWGYASKRDILEDGLTSRVVLLQGARFLASPLVFFLATFVAIFDTQIAILTWLLLIPINGVLQSRLVETPDVPA